MKYLLVVSREVGPTVSSDIFANMYHLCWCVMESTSVVSKGGDVLRDLTGSFSIEEYYETGQSQYRVYRKCV